MPAPALRIPLSLNMEGFDQNIQKAKSVTGEATQFIAKKFVDMNASLIATQGAAGGAVLALRSVVGLMAPLAVAVTGIVGVFRLMGYATELAKEKIEEFNEIAEKAGKANVSTDFFQRFTKSGEQLKLTIEDVTEALNRFSNVSKDILGGSELSQRVTELQKAGNFTGNSGLAALGGSSDTEARLRATIQLIQEAFDAGQRLAGLDIAQKAFGSDLTNRLRQDATILDQMLKTADKMSASKIISVEQVGQAIQLQARLEEAQKVLAERFKPIQDDLAKLGVQYHRSWIELVELMADAVSKANALYSAIKSIPDAFAAAGNATFWTKLTEATDRLGLISRPAGMIMRGEEGFAEPAGNAALRNALSNPNAVRQAMQSATQIQSAVRGDTSIAPKKKEAEEAADAYDRATESLTKHIARQEADTQAVGKGAGAMEQLRATATLYAAAAQAGIDVDAKRAAEILKLAQAAGAAGEALARARVASEIEFGSKTAFLTSEDAQIASQLVKIYGNDIPAAMASAEAAALRAVNGLRQLSELGQDVNRSMFVEFGQGLRNGQSAWESFANAGVNALGRIADKLMSMAADKLWASAFGGSGSSGIANLFGLGGGSSAAPSSIMVGDYAMPKFASGTDYAPGGLALVGENGPEVMNVPRGAQIIPNDILRQSGGGGGAITYAPSIDARGASVEAVARLEQIMERDRASFEIRTVRAIQSARRSRVPGV